MARSSRAIDGDAGSAAPPPIPFGFVEAIAHAPVSTITRAVAAVASSFAGAPIARAKRTNAAINLTDLDPATKDGESHW